MSDTNEPDIEVFIDAARERGTDDPEQEITDLQDLLRVAWTLMSEKQREALAESDEAQAILDVEEDAAERDEE